jgi:nucleoporin POM152
VVCVKCTYRDFCQGTGPWNLEVQVVGPKSSETLRIPDIKTSRTTIHVPIPDAIDKEGGSFDIELGKSVLFRFIMTISLIYYAYIASIEDSYGCKRSLSVPGISVNVRRVQVGITCLVL